MPADEVGGHVSDRDRVVAGITTQVNDGTYTPGARLPSIARLAAEYGTSQTTVKTALALLRDRGTIRGHPGKGIYAPGSAES